MRCGRRRSRCCRLVGGDHPLGCHNPRIADRVCFEGILIRLVTGCSWVTAERLIAHRASDTTLRARRDEWVDAGVHALADEALRGYDRIVGLDLSEAAVDGSIHKAPCVATGPAKALLTGANRAGSGRCCAPGRHPGELGRRRGEPQRRRAVRADRRRRRRAACDVRPCIWTAATTTAPSRPPRPTTASTTSCAPKDANGAPQPSRPQSRWDCDGP